ncbi:Uncharacterised protein [Mycobacteroides abscessus subsp. massiliense]|nr:Uncharacterised protein [Mycobacteroides abscessus subsp. massiliense]
MQTAVHSRVTSLRSSARRYETGAAAASSPLRPIAITSALQSEKTAVWCLDRHTAVSTALALKNPRVSRHWRIRPLSAITCEIPPRSVRTYKTALLPRHIREPRQVQLVRHGDRGRRAVTVLAQDQVGLTAARVIPFERVRAVQQDDHVGVLFQ